MINLHRFSRIIKRIVSRFQDYGELRHAESSRDAVLWFKKHGTSMLNGNVLRAKIVQAAVRAAHCNVFIETGTSHAATAIGANRFLQIPVWSCEINAADFWISRILTLGMPHIRLFNQKSDEFLRKCSIFINERGWVPIIYLDAHEGKLDKNSLPLIDELEIISRFKEFILFIDDFQNPFDDRFVYGTYGGVSLNLSLVEDAFRNMDVCKCYFPGYSSIEETGFVTGFCMISRSHLLDDEILQNRFPFNLLKSVAL